jgi:hypothetical protein
MPAVAGCVTLLAAVGAMLSPPRAAGATPEQIAALKAAPCPSTDFVLRRASYSDAEVAAARSGSFHVFGEYPRRELVPPVDWKQDPHRDRSWTHYLHAFSWIDPLVYAYAIDGDAGAVGQARDLLLDWIQQNPRGAPGTSPWAWNDKGSGDRAPFLAYFTRAAACEGMLTNGQASTLIDATLDHAEFLMLPENHPAHNHALFVDLGLAGLARLSGYLPAAEGWFAAARSGFRRTVTARTEPGEGFWLEHSTGYQFLVVSLVERFVAIAGDGTFGGLLNRMRWAAGWLVTPAGSQVPYGDSNEEGRVPTWAKRVAADDNGLFFAPRSGLAAVKDRDGYLLVTAAFHNRTHKHADDLGFHLYDRGRDVVTDSGVFSYNLDAWLGFSRSTDAHSVLTVGRHGFPTFDEGFAYGSGLLAAGTGRGWYAILGRNPLLRKRHVRHRRLFLYRPGRALLVIDRVRARKPRRYRRRIQLAPGLTVRKAKPRRVAFRGGGLAGRIRDAGPRPNLDVVAGHYNPPRGWSFPRQRQRVARSTLTYASRARNANFVSAIGLRGGARARMTRASRRSFLVAVRGRATGRGKLRITKRGNRLRVKRAR